MRSTRTMPGSGAASRRATLSRDATTKQQLTDRAVKTATTERSRSVRVEGYPSGGRSLSTDRDRGLDSVVASAATADVVTESVTRTESTVYKSQEDVDIVQESIVEMGVEELFTYEAEVEVIEPEDVEDDEKLSLQQALDCTANRGHSVLPDDFSTPRSDSTTQISDLCLAFPMSDVQMPTYTGTDLDIGIAHFGVGGFFRAHQLAYMDYLLRHNLEENHRWGYIGIGMLPQDKAMRDALREQENMYTVVAHSATASSEAGPDSESDVSENVRVVAALKDMLLAPEEPGQVLRTLASEGTKIYSLTITEFGYTVPTSRADMTLAQVAKDAAKEPWDAMDANAKRYAGATAVGMIVAGLQARRAYGTGGATILSCDNIPGNGDYVRDKVLERAESIGDGLKEWILFNCTFPNCMVDRITPMTTETVKESLSNKHGIKDNWPVVCETFSQWVIEDNFVEGLSGRPRWETVGVQLVRDVKPFELAKIRLLNVTHSVMTFPALLMGLEHVHDAAVNPLVKEYFTYVMREELRPTLLDIEGIENINLEKYQDILENRFSNTLVADTLMRISHDTSNKFSIQGCPAVRDGLALGLSMKGMAFMVACWAHFILKCRRAEIEFKDGQSAALQAALADNDINALLDLGPIFHDLMFEDRWRELAVGYFNSIHTEGIRKVLRDFNASNAKQ